MLRTWIPLCLVAVVPASALAAPPNLPAICEKNVAKADPKWRQYESSTNFEAMDEAVKGSHALVEKRGRCQDSGSGAAQASEKKVHDGPNYEQRRKDAGAGAHASAFAKCFTPKMQAEYTANAKKLFALENARDAAAFDELTKKFK